MGGQGVLVKTAVAAVLQAYPTHGRYSLEKDEEKSHAAVRQPHTCYKLCTHPPLGCNRDHHSSCRKNEHRSGLHICLGTCFLVGATCTLETRGIGHQNLRLWLWPRVHHLILQRPWSRGQHTKGRALHCLGYAQRPRR